MPCWSITGGLAHPDAYADAAVCRTVRENIGDLNSDQVSVSVSPTLLNRSKNVPIHVTITYRQAVTSPLLRIFMAIRSRPPVTPGANSRVGPISE